MISSKSITQIAKAAGVEQKLVARLLSSQRALLAPKHSLDNDESLVEIESKYLDLGLRLDNSELFLGLVGKLSSEGVIRVISEAIREYTKICPQVTGWIGRGDYDPKKLPTGVSTATLKHASRTAGRLRAKVLRAK